MRTRSAWALALFVALAATACEDKEKSDNTPPPDTTAPAVTAIEPADKAAAVALDAKVKVTFSEAVDPASVDVQLLDGKQAKVDGKLSVADDALSASFAPTAALSENASYSVSVAAYKDVAGNAGSPAGATFTTAAVAPTVLSTAPAKDAIQVALDTTVKVDFSEPMNADSVKAGLKLKDGTADVAGTVTSEGASATFKPAAQLLENHQYTIDLATSVTDLAGVALAAPVSVSFTTKGDAVNVVSTVPADGAIDVQPDSAIKYVFSKDLDPSTVTAANFPLTQGGTAVATDVNYDASSLTVTVKPKANLAEGSTYESRATKNVKGKNGLALPADKVVGFKVLLQPPTVVAIAPNDAAQNVPLNTRVEATFSEPLDTSTINDQSFFLKDGANTVAATVSYDAASKKATLTPSSDLFEGKSYTATVSTAVKDLAGNAMAAAKSWSFTTLTTIPTVTGVVPANNATAVSGNAPVKVTFSESMDSASFTASTFQVKNGTTDIAGTRTWDEPTRTAIFQPTGAYPGGATISVKVTTGAKDRSGIGIASDFTSSFTVSNAPSVSSSVPAPNDVDVALNAAVTLTFGTSMDKTTLTSANIWIEDAQGTKLASNVAGTDTQATITPNAAFNESTTYTVVVTTAVKSSNGVPFTQEYRFTFTTVGVPPTVAAVTPADKSTDVPVSSKVKITFNEDMDTATFAAANLKVTDGANDVAGTVNVIDSKNVEFAPTAKLKERSTYTVIAGTGFTDKAGNALAAAFTSTFSTEALPRIVYAAPPPGATGVPTNASLLVAFNKTLTGTFTVAAAGGGTPGTFTLYEDGTRIDGAATWDAATLTLRLQKKSNGAVTAFAPNKRYTVEADGTALTDANGNAVGGRPSTTFTTGAGADTTGPTVSGTSPQDGDTGVSRRVRPTATFSEAMDPSTINGTTVRLLDGATALSGKVIYDQAANEVTFVPDAKLAPTKQYTFEVSTGVKDLAGNGKAALNSIAFTTEANELPTVSRVYPADQSTNIAINRSVRVDFSEAIDASSLQLTLTSGIVPAATAGATTYDANTATAVFHPTADLAPNTTYTVTVKAGLKDLEGGTTTADIVAGTFTTVANSAKDIVVPTVAGTSPANAATGVDSRSLIFIAFSKAMDTTTVRPAAFSLTETTGGAKVPFSLFFEPAAQRAVLVPGVPLKAATSYSVAVLAGVTDLSGNQVDPAAASSKFSFTVDGSAPSVASSSPASGTTVGNGGQIRVTFSEDMDPSTIDSASFTLSFGGTKRAAAVFYNQATRTAVLQPATIMADGQQTVTLDATRITDLAGNKLSATGATFTFNVSSSGPSVSGVVPCGALVDAANFASQTITFTFDRGVKKSGGGALDAGTLKLQLAGADQAITVAHNAGDSTATVTPASALQEGKTYDVVATTLVADNATGVAMASQFTCSFKTQRVKVSPADNSTGFTANAAQGGNQWTRVNSTLDAHNNVVWHAGNATDGQNYVRAGGLNPANYTLTLDRQVDLTGFTDAELRFEEMHGIAATDVARITVVSGGVTTVLQTINPGTTTAYAPQKFSLKSFVNNTVTIHFELVITGQATLGTPAAGGKGLFIDNVYVVGQ